MFFILVLIILIQPLTQLNASVSNDSDLCLHATHKYEKAFDIKPLLLTTISHVESGRYNEQKNAKAPWPWTINFKGKGMWFANKAQAVKKVKELQARGYKSIDVGCMQVNLMFHGKAFDSVEDAFNVDQNVYYAATFLTDLYERNDKNWDKAIMHYHSRKEAKGNRYKKKIDEQLKLVEDITSKYKFLNFTMRYKDYAWREAKLQEYRRKKLENNRS
ncbi:MAG: transglycosylase SLT domain-containing protein [Alphaproteobacteria bacterium]